MRMTAKERLALGFFGGLSWFMVFVALLPVVMD
jgi:hypothetical protein